MKKYDIEYIYRDSKRSPISLRGVTSAKFLTIANEETEITNEEMASYDFRVMGSGTYYFYSDGYSVGSINVQDVIAMIKDISVDLLDIAIDNM